MNTTKMQPAAFEVGQVVEYIGDRWLQDEKGNDLLKIGMRFTIEETRLPERGIGKFGVDDDGEDMIDRDDDGYNVIRFSDGRGRIIWPADKHQWKAI